jgi:hypothetical protein
MTKNFNPKTFIFTVAKATVDGSVIIELTTTDYSKAYALVEALGVDYTIIETELD